LRPAPHCRTRIRSYSLTVTPAQHFVNWQQDPHGNWLARFVFPEKSKELSITVDLIADMEVINPFDFFIEPHAEKWPFSFPPELHEDLAAFVTPEPAGPLLAELIRSIPRIDKDAGKRARLEAIGGMVPSLIDPPPGCRFAPRCRFAQSACMETVPELRRGKRQQSCRTPKSRFTF